MAFDVERALKAGYTQEEINQFLSQQPQEKPNFDVEGALKAGYTQEEIDQYLVTQQQPIPPQQPVTPEPVATQPKPMNFDIEGALAAGYTQEEINQFLIAQGQPLRPEDVGFFDRTFESIKQGVKQFGGTATGYDVAISAVKGDAEAVAKKITEAKAQQAQEALSSMPTFTAADIQRIFEEKNIISAGAQVPSFLIEQILKNGPQMIPPIVASIAVTALAAPTGPFAPLIGGAAGVVTYGLQQFGNFMERQALERNAPEDIDVGKAALWSAVTAPIGFFADRLTLGLTKIGSKEAGKQVMKELAERQAGKVAAVKAGAAQAGKQAGVGIIAEAPTEVLEQMAERYQAGLDLTSEEAKKEYFEAFWSAAAVGGGLGTASGAYTSYRDYQNAKQIANESTDTTVSQEKDKKPSRDTIIKEEFDKIKAKVAEEKAQEEASKKVKKQAIIDSTPPDVQQNSTGVLDEATLTSFGIPKKSQKKLVGLDFNNPKDVEIFDVEVQNLTNLNETLIDEYKLKLSDEAIKDGRLDDKRNRISYEISSGPYNAISEGAGSPLGSSVLEYTTDARTITGRVEEPSNTLDQQVKEDNKTLTKQALGIVEEPVTEEAVVEEVTETVEATPTLVVEEVNEVTEDQVTPTIQEEVTPEELNARNIAVQLNALDPGNPLISELQDPFVTEDVIREAYAEVKARRDKRTADQVQQNILEKEFRLEPDEYYSFESFSNPQPEIVSTTKNNKNLGQVFNNLKQNHFNKLPLSYQNLINVLAKIPGVNGTKYRVGEFVTEKGARGKYFAQTNSAQIDPQRGNVQTILHEAVHSATVSEMRRQIEVNRNDKTGEITYTGKTKAAKTVLNIYEAAKAAVAGTPEAGSYGLTDPLSLLLKRSLMRNSNKP
jgi:alkylhydroperoxidase/carboxymuconolactone decarboxylase family protein YurZ